MPRANRGEVWIIDLGMVAKVRPCLILSVPIDPQDRVLVSFVPHTTSAQGTRFEVAVQARFLQGKGVFDAQQIATIPQAKLIRKLGDLPSDHWLWSSRRCEAGWVFEPSYGHPIPTPANPPGHAAVSDGPAGTLIPGSAALVAESAAAVATLLEGARPARIG